jgi:hypothetical protein
MTFGQTRHMVITHQPSSFPATVGYPQARTISASAPINIHHLPAHYHFPLALCHSPLPVTPRCMSLPATCQFPLHVTPLTSHQRPTIIESAPIPCCTYPLEQPSAHSPPRFQSSMASICLLPISAPITNDLLNYITTSAPSPSHAFDRPIKWR